jgi:hypothetical protein
MSNNPIPEMAVSDREIKAQAQGVNQLLHELEPMLDDNQHQVITELLAERAVLAAMRARVELEEVTKRRQSPTGEEAPTSEATPNDEQTKGAH